MTNKLMHTSKFFIAIVFTISLSFMISAYNIDPNEYLNEFNNAEEICIIDDAFFYTDSNNKLSLVIVYGCCKDNGCIKIPFDIQNQRELSLLDLEETFNINFVRDKIRSGDLVPSNYFPESFDVCAYFSEKLPEQSRSLAVKTADSVEEFAPRNAQKIYRTMRGAGFATGLISEFEIGVFIVGVGCNKLSKQENEAFFKVGECYNSIQSIESGAAHYGIISETYICMQDADFLLSQVLESWGQKIKGAFNKVASTAKAIWNWGKDLAQGNLSTNLDITETSYEAAQRIKDKLNIEKDYLENSNSLVLSANTQRRLSEKRYLSQITYNTLREEYDLLNKKIPGKFEQFVQNIIYDPNIDYNESRFYLEKAKTELNLMEEWIDISKYNSALRLNSSIYFNTNEGFRSYASRSEIKKKIDIMSVMFWMIVIGIGIFLVVNYIKKKRIY